MVSEVPLMEGIVAVITGVGIVFVTFELYGKCNKVAVLLLLLKYVVQVLTFVC